MLLKLLGKHEIQTFVCFFALFPKSSKYHRSSQTIIQTTISIQNLNVVFQAIMAYMRMAISEITIQLLKDKLRYSQI